MVVPCLRKHMGCIHYKIQAVRAPFLPYCSQRLHLYCLPLPFQHPAGATGGRRCIHTSGLLPFPMQPLSLPPFNPDIPQVLTMPSRPPCTASLCLLQFLAHSQLRCCHPLPIPLPRRCSCQFTMPTRSPYAASFCPLLSCLLVSLCCMPRMCPSSLSPSRRMPCRCCLLLTMPVGPPYHASGLVAVPLQS